MLRIILSRRRRIYPTSITPNLSGYNISGLHIPGSSSWPTGHTYHSGGVLTAVPRLYTPAVACLYDSFSFQARAVVGSVEAASQPRSGCAGLPGDCAWPNCEGGYARSCVQCAVCSRTMSRTPTPTAAHHASDRRHNLSVRFQRRKPTDFCDSPWTPAFT